MLCSALIWSDLISSWFLACSLSVYYLGGLVWLEISNLDLISLWSSLDIYILYWSGYTKHNIQGRSQFGLWELMLCKIGPDHWILLKILVLPRPYTITYLWITQSIKLQKMALEYYHESNSQFGPWDLTYEWNELHHWTLLKILALLIIHTSGLPTVCRHS